jgi:predicted Zn finger-like uncharacterized protein
MEVSCPNCYTTYPINPERIPEKGATPTCKKCGVAFTIVKATGDPVKDRAQRMKGYVLVRETSRREEIFRETEALSKKPSQKAFSVKAILENKHFRLGASIAGVALLLCSAAFFIWKSQVHSRFEKTLKTTFAQASSKRFTVAFEDLSFSLLGGLSRDQGCIHGLNITDQENHETLRVTEKIDFVLEPSKKHFITKPFNAHMDGKVCKTVLKGCVLEAQERGGPYLKFKVDEAFSVVNGIELFTVREMEVSFSINGTEWKENPRFVLGDGDFGFRASEIYLWSEPVVRNADILVSVKNGLFTKDQQAGEASPVNHMEIFRTKWGENKAVASLERFSLQVLGSAVKATGKLEFQNPVEGSEASLRVSIKDFSHIMKYIHRLNESVFDRIVVTLVALDERKATVYKQDSDSLDLILSYKNSKIKINDQDLQGFI